MPKHVYMIVGVFNKQQKGDGIISTPKLLRLRRRLLPHYCDDDDDDSYYYYDDDYYYDWYWYYYFCQLLLLLLLLLVLLLLLSLLLLLLLLGLLLLTSSATAGPSWPRVSLLQLAPHPEARSLTVGASLQQRIPNQNAMILR